MILETNASGSAWVEPAGEIQEDDGSDILRECAGGCGQKILLFTFSVSDDWAEKTEGALCLECKTRLIASGSL